MQLKPRYVLVITLAIVLSSLLQIQFGIFSRYNYITACWDKNREKIRLLAYGKELLTATQRTSIANKMGFDVIGIADCYINSSASSGADSYNIVMTAYLDKKLGKSWKRKFDHSVDSLFRMQSGSRIRNAILNNEEVKQMIKNYDPQKRTFTYVDFIDLTNADSTHANARICMKYKSETIVIGYFIVNPYTLHITQIVY